MLKAVKPAITPETPGLSKNQRIMKAIELLHVGHKPELTYWANRMADRSKVRPV